MISDDDIKLCANALVTMFVKDAPVRCATRVEEYMAKDEKEEYRFLEENAKGIVNK